MEINAERKLIINRKYKICGIFHKLETCQRARSKIKLWDIRTHGYGKDL